MVNPSQDEVWLVRLDPTQGSEIRKARPCLVVSPDEMNRHLRTIIIAPQQRPSALIQLASALPFKANVGRWPSTSCAR
jgi:mRNA interferase MazF